MTIYFTLMSVDSCVVLLFVRLEDKIVEVGGSRVQQQQSKLKAVNKEIELLTDAITKAKVSIKTAERYFVCVCVCVQCLSI